MGGDGGTGLSSSGGDSDALAAAIAVAATEAASRVAAALGAAGIQAQATTEAAGIQAAADNEVAITQAQAQRDVAQTRANADVQVASLTSGATRYAADDGLQGTKYSSDKQLTGVEYAQDAETARLNTTLDFALARWNQIFPLVQGFLQNPSTGGGTSSTWGQLTAALGGPPAITQGGIFTPAMIRARVNQVYCRADRKAATDLHDTQVDLAGRGFSASSPLLAMLEFSYEAAAIEASIMGAVEVVNTSAQANAEQLLKQQSERQDQYAAQQQAYTALNKVAADLAASIFGSVTSMVGAIAR